MGIHDELTKLIDQRIDQRLGALTLRLDRGVVRAFNQVEEEVDPDDDGGGSVVRRGRRKKKKARRSKKATASTSATRGKKKRRKSKRRGTATSIAEGRETVLSLLKQKGPMRVTQIVNITGVAQSTINKRLNELKDERLVVRLKEGTHIVYKAARDGSVGRKTAAKSEDKNGARKSEPPASGEIAA